MKKLYVFFLLLFNVHTVFLMEVKHQHTSLSFKQVGEVQSACFNKDDTELLILIKTKNNFIVSTFKNDELATEIEIDRNCFKGIASYNASENKIIIQHLFSNKVSVVDRKSHEISEYLLPEDGEFVCFNKTETELLMRLPYAKCVLMQDINTNKVLFSASYSDPFVAACLNENETEIATVTCNGRLHIWDKKTAKELLTEGYGFCGITEKSVSFCPQAQQLLIYGASPLVWLQDRYMSKNVAKTFRHPATVMCARRNGDRICTMACDQKIRIWDIKNKEIIKTIPLESLWINSLEWSSDGTKIVAGFGTTVAIWSCED